MKIQDFLDNLEKVRVTREHQWQACCPAHDDRTPSLSIALGDDERILLTCHAGCDVQSILQALHLELKDLFPKANKTSKKTNEKVPATPRDDGFFGTFEEFNKNPYPDLPGLIDWEELFCQPAYEQEWLAPYLIPKGKLISFFGPTKLGKSLLVLDAVAAIVTGKDFLGRPTQRVKVLYLDFENHPGNDIRPRLEAMGYQWDELDDLFYLSYPGLDFLDTPAGGQRLYEMVKRHGIELVIIDTIARIVEGKENSNDTWNDLEKYTERLLKRDGVTFLRIDHIGHESATRARGGSAKQGDVDISWQLEKTKDNQLRLKSNNHRFPLDHNSLVISRETKPVLHHQLVSSTRRLAPDERVELLSNLLDNHHYPAALTVTKTAEALRELGEHASTDLASKVRRERMKRPASTSNSQSIDNDNSDSPPSGTWGWFGHSSTQSTTTGMRNNVNKSQCTKRKSHSAHIG
jgi:hypothetical protein